MENITLEQACENLARNNAPTQLQPLIDGINRAMKVLQEVAPAFNAKIGQHMREVQVSLSTVKLPDWPSTLSL